jgi:2-(1,2-epoxy-1,2-dihydrophenyl)acetyl-CoA isomerase
MDTDIMTLARARAVVDELYSALASGNVEATAAVLADEFVGRLSAGLPFGIGGEHRGAEAMIRDGWFAIGRHWQARAFTESYELLDGGRLCVQGTYRGRSRKAGNDFEARFTHIVEFEGDRIASLTQVTDADAFIRALGDDLPLRTIDLTVNDGLAVLRLNRPQARNAIDQLMADELLVAARRISCDASVRAVLICGAGRDLTVGGDIAFFTENTRDDLGGLLKAMTMPFHLAFEVLAALDVPIVTAARGSAAGGGLGLVYAADIVIAAEDARFVTAFGQIGLSGDGGGTWHLPRRIGPARAAAAYLLGTPISARDALSWGLVAEVVPGEELDTRALEVARGLAQGPTRAYGAMRRLLHSTWGNSLGEQHQAEVAALQACARTQDANNAIAAFLSKQNPTFEGA